MRPRWIRNRIDGDLLRCRCERCGMRAVIIRTTYSLLLEARRRFIAEHETCQRRARAAA